VTICRVYLTLAAHAVVDNPSGEHLRSTEPEVVFSIAFSPSMWNRAVGGIPGSPPLRRRSDVCVNPLTVFVLRAGARGLGAG
jgi:hypothetical protein